MFLPILLFLCEKGGYIFSRRGWHEMIYMELCVLCALCVELGKNLCFFHAEVADYAEIFGTVFVVALLGYVLRSLRSLRGIGNGPVLFFTQRSQITRRYSVLFSLSLD